MYTLKDLSSVKFVLLEVSDILKLEDVKGISIYNVSEKRKKIEIKISFFDYLFAVTFKNTLRDKVKNDLGNDFDLEYGIKF